MFFNESFSKKNNIFINFLFFLLIIDKFSVDNFDDALFYKLLEKKQLVDIYIITVNKLVEKVDIYSQKKRKNN